MFAAMRRHGKRTAFARLLAFVVTACAIHSGCASQMARSPYVKSYVDGQDFAAALEEIEQIDKGTSRLLYLYEKGLVLHYSARYDESNEALEEAERLYDDLYTKSLSRELGSLLTSDNIIQYRGERFETALVHYYKILNYLSISRPEEAVVECRKLNNRLRTFADSGDSVYVNDPFLQYLTGMVYFEAGEVQDADVSLRVALDTYNALEKRYGVDVPVSLYCDLIRCAETLGDEEAASRYRDAADSCGAPGPGERFGTVNVFLECGYVSYKVEENVVFPIYKNEVGEDTDVDEFARGLTLRYGQPVDTGLELDYLLRIALPAMVPSPEPFVDAGVRVYVDGKPRRTRVQVVENLDALAFEAFESHRGLIMVKTVSRALAKYLAKQGADKENALAGWLVNLFNVATEGADIRSWATLPQTIRMARLVLPEGTYDLEIILHNQIGDEEESYAIKDVKVIPGRSTFLSYRIN